MNPRHQAKNIGTLVDSEIIQLAQQGELITTGFNESSVKQACYELRSSDTYYNLDSPDRSLRVAAGSSILIKPKQAVVIITEESLSLPDDMLGRILSKGQLFSLGIVPVNTYADPGFSGQLGVVMINSSNDYLAIPPYATIAKIEFVRLAQPVSESYQGQHGFKTGIWPIKRDFILTAQQVRQDPRIGNPVDELARAYGPDFGLLIKRIYRYERRLLFCTITYSILTLGIIVVSANWEDRLSVGLAVGLGIISNAIFSLIAWSATHLLRPRQ